MYQWASSSPSRRLVQCQNLREKMKFLADTSKGGLESSSEVEVLKSEYMKTRTKFQCMQKIHSQMAKEYLEIKGRQGMIDHLNGTVSHDTTDNTHHHIEFSSPGKDEEHQSLLYAHKLMGITAYPLPNRTVEFTFFPDVPSFNYSGKSYQLKIQEIVIDTKLGVNGSKLKRILDHNLPAFIPLEHLCNDFLNVSIKHFTRAILEHLIVGTLRLNNMKRLKHKFPGKISKLGWSKDLSLVHWTMACGDRSSIDLVIYDFLIEFSSPIKRAPSKIIIESQGKEISMQEAVFDHHKNTDWIERLEDIIQLLNKDDSEIYKSVIERQ